MNFIPKLKSVQETFQTEKGDNLFSPTFIDRTGVYDTDIDLSSIKNEVEQASTEFTKRKFNLCFKTLLEEAKIKNTIHAIISVTGDDEIIATNAKVLPILHFICAKYISEIELSEKDTGISNRKGNYAEGWVYLPPNREASIDAVMRRHKSTGIAILMDLIKLKQISAVRKQSQLETDFESKYKDLYKSTEWIDQDWLTYDYGQMALIFATCIFDYRESKTSPFLFKTEGGCGGIPPWNNLDTALAGFDQMSRGYATQSNLWIMTESTLIQKNKISPKNAKFVNASHYAQKGSKSLGELKGLAKKLSTLSKEEKINLLESTRDEDPIPPELKEKSIIVQPTDKLLGCAISELRKNGLVMTELDLQTEIAKRNKYAALLGNTNMGMVMKEQDENLEKARRNGYRILASLGQSETVLPVDNPHLTMKEYYTMRKDFSDITAFSYAGEIRIFKSMDVLKYYESQAGSLRDEVSLGMAAAKNFRTSQKQGREKEKIEYQIDWMESGEITELFEGELPPGIGSDDARILRKISMQLPTLKYPTVFIVVTDDLSMIKKIEGFLSKWKLANIIHIYRVEYIRECMANVAPKRKEVTIYNFITGRECTFSGLSARIARFSLYWRQPPQYQIIWDFPNIDRGLEPIKINWRHNQFFIPNGGYLKRATVLNNKTWAQIPWEDFKNLKDFKIKRSKISAFKMRAQRGSVLPFSHGGCA